MKSVANPILGSQIKNKFGHRAIDRFGMLFSVLCGFHCLLTPFILVSVPWFSSFISNEVFHLVMLLLVIPVVVMSIIQNNGSVQHLDISDSMKEKYKTAWEIKQKNIIDMSVDRGKYICQSQSLNLSIEAPTFKTISSMHFYSWKKGLKTGMYYLRSRPSSKAIQFTVAPESCENCSG